MQVSLGDKILNYCTKTRLTEQFFPIHQNLDIC
jgi:hypothetical protein